MPCYFFFCFGFFFSFRIPVPLAIALTPFLEITSRRGRLSQAYSAFPK